MKNIKSIYTFGCLVIMIANAIIANAQFVVTNLTNQSIKTVLEEQFLGEGVKLDTTHSIYYNNSTTINGNQIGTFTNQDTSYSGKNLPIKKGLILATTAVKNIANGYESTQGKVSGAGTYAPALYTCYQNFVNNPDLNKYGCKLNGDNGKFNCISVLDFWVIPQACSMSFRYCFGSEEYPNYVCTSFNDFFVLCCDGPYNDDGSAYTDQGIFYPNPTNIAILPDSYDDDDFTMGTPVMINTCNNGNSSKNCGIDNEGFFIDNRDKPCKTNSLGGYTRRLTTAEVQTVPGKKYHIQIAICNIDDEALQSAVLLEANSFTAEKIEVQHAMTQTGNNEGYKVFKNSDDHLEYIYMKGCSTDTMILAANYIAKADEQPYTFFVKSSDGSNIIRGKDYDYFRINQDGSIEDISASNMVTLPIGETSVRYLLYFLHNPEKSCNEIDTLLFISTDCNGDPVDTLRYLMKEPCPMEVTAQGGLTVCHDKVPVIDSINITLSNPVSYALLNATRNSQLIYQDILQTNFYGDDTTFNIKIPVTIMDPNDTASVYIHAEDYCGRSFDTVIYYNVVLSSTMASADKYYICEGDSVVLSCPTAASYTWTAYPKDTSLASNNKSKQQSLTVIPQQNTTYKVVAVSEEGCISSDSLKISVELIIKAEMEINPKKVYHSNPEISYKELSDNTFDRLWFFGDGSNSTYREGYHTYIPDTAEDSHMYPITLIVYNKAMCPDTLIDSVEVASDFSLWMPNAFIPGYYDGRVTTFGPKGKLLNDYELIIFNRWGTRVFRAKNKNWDGTLDDGSTAPQGTYVYHLLYKDGRKTPQLKSGTFTLIPADGQR